MRPPLDGAILVTGASSGIGRELARQFAPKARRLILVARREDRLRELAKELARPGLEIMVRPCDLSDATDVDRLIGEAGDVDVLVNNAGLADVGLFEMCPWSKLDSIVRVDVNALTQLTHRLLGPMLKRGRGGILNISSGWGLTWIPGMAAYAAAKHFVTALTECLRLEVKSAGVVVSQACPGPVDSEFLEVSGNPTGRDMPGIIRIDAAKAARLIARGFAKGRGLIIPGISAKILIALGRLSPRWLLRLVYGWIGAWLRKRQRTI